MIAVQALWTSADLGRWTASLQRQVMVQHGRRHVLRRAEPLLWPRRQDVVAFLEVVYGCTCGVSIAVNKPVDVPVALGILTGVWTSRPSLTKSGLTYTARCVKRSRR